MRLHDLALAVDGAVLLGYATIALFFLKFWRQTRLRLFAWFALAFMVLTSERLMLLSAPAEWVHRPLFYCTRLVAFLIIAGAIWDRNRTRN
jgi:hypothetical protein